MGGWDQEVGFEEVPLDHPAAPALKPASNSSKLSGGGGSAEAARLRKQVAELQAGLKAAEAVSECNVYQSVLAKCFEAGSIWHSEEAC